jgi:hypothetical protein
MTKIFLALSLTLATASGALAGALDAYQPQASNGGATLSVSGVSDELISFNRAGNDGSPMFEAPVEGGIDYTATASIGGGSDDRIVYHRAGNDGSPSFN